VLSFVFLKQGRPSDYFAFEQRDRCEGQAQFLPWRASLDRRGQRGARLGGVRDLQMNPHKVLERVDALAGDLGEGVEMDDGAIGVACGVTELCAELRERRPENAPGLPRQSQDLRCPRQRLGRRRRV